MVNTADTNRLYAGFHVLAFGKNNEYFDTVIDGYTLFGYQFNPYAWYQLNDKVRFDVGLYLQKDFGNTDFTAVAPTLSLKIKHKNLSVIIGTLEGALHHQLIEPLYDFERVLNRRLENGAQLQWNTESLFADAWVNWEKMIYFSDEEQEQFVAGLSIDKRIAKAGKWTLTIPLQSTVRHAGGQIDTSALPLTTIFNAAAGLTAINKRSGFINEYGLKTYTLVYENLTSRSLSFKDGNGLYINVYATTRWGLTMMASYWNASQYLSFDGGPIYTVANEWYPDVKQQSRTIIMLRFLYELPLAKGVTFTARVEPFYDALPKAMQYAYGFYLNVSDHFFIGNAKK